MNSNSWVAVGGGAAVGAWLRYFFSLHFDSLFHFIPLGTLASNILGGFLMGFAVAYFNQKVSLAPEIRLAVTTGFLGGLTTFSTFSAETVTLLIQHEYYWTILIILSHVIGSLSMTALGILAMNYFFTRKNP
jgi:fluoride exporter